jgi:hypothetical protein
MEKSNCPGNMGETARGVLSTNATRRHAYLLTWSLSIDGQLQILIAWALEACTCWSLSTWRLQMLIYEHLKIADADCMSCWRLQMLIYEHFRIPWAIAGLEMLIHEHLRIADALKIQRSFKEAVSLMYSWAVLSLEMYTKRGSNEECLLFPQGWDVQGNWFGLLQNPKCNWSHEQALAKFTLNVNETECLWTR